MDKKVKRSLDEATKLKLAGLFPCNNDFTVTFTPEAYKEIDAELQPKFTIKPYNAKELKEVMAKSQALTGDALDDYAHDMIRKHIAGWSNLVNLSTNDLVDPKFDGDVLTKESYDMLPVVVKTSLMQQIMKISVGISG